MDLGKFEKKEYFVNRELSWLKFDERVLSEARDKNLPLFDRLKFLSITASNLDEFFMVRVASLKDQVHAGYHKTDIAGMTAKEQLKEISVRTHELVHVQYNTLNRSLIPALEKAGMHLVAAHENLTEAQSAFVDRYFEDNVYPVLTPMAMDSSRPFPLIRNKTLNETFGLDDDRYFHEPKERVTRAEYLKGMEEKRMELTKEITRLFYKGYSSTETAKMLNVSRATVARRKNDAKKLGWIPFRGKFFQSALSWKLEA